MLVDFEVENFLLLPRGQAAEHGRLFGQGVPE